jgi:hypothetical protein
MQTPIQELMEWMEKNEFMVNKGFIEKLNECFEKEKEQIITDYSNGFLNGLGYKKEDKDIMYGVIMQSKAEGDIYYNETYNENK